MSATLPLSAVVAEYLPGSAPQPWTWDDEERDILARVCLCCGEPGHYQLQLEAHLREHGLGKQGVCLGDDGRVWDGHHRIVAARRLGIDTIPLESSIEAAERFDRDHAPLDSAAREVPDNLLTPPEIARRFHVHPHTVRRWIAQGKLRSFKTMGGHNRVRSDDVRQLLIKQIDERSMSGAQYG